jgi:hypothetical protein
MGLAGEHDLAALSVEGHVRQGEDHFPTRGARFEIHAHPACQVCVRELDIHGLSLQLRAVVEFP